MKRNPLLIAAALAALLSASSCSVDGISAIPAEAKLSASAVIPPEEALGNLEVLLVDIYGQTKSGIPSYDSESLSVFGGAVTKSAESALPDTSVYIVNFAGESGFAVLAAQRAMSTPVFCITEAGTLTSEDLNRAIQRLDETSEPTHTGFSEDREFVPMLLAASIVNQMSEDGDPSGPDGNDPDTDDEDTSGENDGEDGGGFPGGGGISGQTVLKVGPLLKTKWHQEAPFNDFQENGYYAGCVAVATGQILTYNKFGTAGGRTFDWDSLETVCHYTQYIEDIEDEERVVSSPASDALASDFMEFLGLKENCNIKYGADGSPAFADGAKNTLVNFGYKNVTKYLSYNDEKVIELLKKELPVYVGGRRTNGGHAWIMDGLIVKQYVRTSTGQVFDVKNILHINWGWNGDFDGYYDEGVFNTTMRLSIEEGLDSGKGWNENRNYTMLYRTVVYSL